MQTCIVPAPVAMTDRARPVYARSVDAQNPADTALHLAELRREHRELDDAIAQLVAAIEADEVAVKRMKKRKLWLKDCIARLESSLIPDEPA